MSSTRLQTGFRTWPRTEPRRLLPAWLLVGLLHVLLALLLWKQPVWADRTSPVVDRPPLVVTLWQRVRETTLAPQPPTTLRRREQPSQPQPKAPEPQAITLPTASTPAPTPADAAPAGTPPADLIAPPAMQASKDPAAPRLNLALPRGASAPWRQRNPALDDPRSNTAKLSMEQKLANAMGGDGTWTEERVDLDHVRYRRGDQCIIATRTRAGQLELANGAFRNAWTVREC